MIRCDNTDNHHYGAHELTNACEHPKPTWLYCPCGQVNNSGESCTACGQVS